MKDKIYVLALLCLVLLANNGCKKKEPKPYGQNIVRCTIDGVKYTTNRDFSNTLFEGINKSLTDTNRFVAAVFGVATRIGVGYFPQKNKVGTVNFTERLSNGFASFGMDATIKVLGSDGSYHYITYRSYINSGSVILSHNNINFIAGTFSGVLMKDTASSKYGPMHIQISDGYFDLPIK
jgi:hypothetical protein